LIAGATTNLDPTMLPVDAYCVTGLTRFDTYHLPVPTSFVEPTSSMARIPYPDPSRYEGQPLVERIRRERGGQLLNLYRMLLHSPSVTEGWLAFLTAIRHKAELPARYRELAILRVAVLNGAEYEFEAHVPFALQEGISRAAIDAVRANPATSDLDEADRAVVAYADAMTREIHVPDDVFARIRERFAERDVVELTATIAAYNCVSRFLEALRIDPERAPAGMR
jgi:alkylhydroperoxidase family enzyme